MACAKGDQQRGGDLHAFLIQMLSLDQSNCISKAAPLRLRQVWAEYKNKVTDVSDSYWYFGTPCNYKLKLLNCKICVSKLWKNYSNMNERMSGQKL